MSSRPDKFTKLVKSGKSDKSGKPATIVSEIKSGKSGKIGKSGKSDAIVSVVESGKSGGKSVVIISDIKSGGDADTGTKSDKDGKDSKSVAVKGGINYGGEKVMAGITHGSILRAKLAVATTALGSSSSSSSSSKMTAGMSKSGYVESPREVLLVKACEEFYLDILTTVKEKLDRVLGGMESLGDAECGRGVTLSRPLYIPIGHLIKRRYPVNHDNPPAPRPRYVGGGPGWVKDFKDGKVMEVKVVKDVKDGKAPKGYEVGGREQSSDGSRTESRSMTPVDRNSPYLGSTLLFGFRSQFGGQDFARFAAAGVDPMPMDAAIAKFAKEKEYLLELVPQLDYNTGLLHHRNKCLKLSLPLLPTGLEEGEVDNASGGETVSDEDDD